MAFLASLGIKDAIYAGLIILLGVGAALYHHKVVKEGEAIVVAADTKAVTAARQRDEVLQTTAALAASIAEGTYEKTITAPAPTVAAPIGLCHEPRNSGAVPNPVAADKGGNDKAEHGSTDPSVAETLSAFADALVKIGVDADAQITALQTENAALRAEMLGANHGH